MSGLGLFLVFMDQKCKFICLQDFSRYYYFGWFFGCLRIGNFNDHFFNVHGEGYYLNCIGNVCNFGVKNGSVFKLYCEVVPYVSAGEILSVSCLHCCTKGSVKMDKMGVFLEARVFSEFGLFLLSFL